MPRPAETAVLSAVQRNVKALVLEHYRSVNAFAKDKGMVYSTIRRITEGLLDPTTGMVDDIASKFRLEGWMLLRSDFDPKAAPAPAALSPDALSVAASLDGIADPKRRARAYAKVANAIIQALGESDLPSPDAPAPAPAPKPARVKTR